MPPAIAFYDVVLFIHVSAVVIAFGVIFAYPVIFSVLGRRPVAERAGFHEAQRVIGQRLISPALLVVVLAGAYLASDGHYWSKVWVTVPLIIAIVTGAMGGVFFAPRERKLAELARSGGGGDYETVYAQVRTGGMVAAALILVAIFFMTTKPG